VHVYCSIKSATTSALTCPASRPQQQRRALKKWAGQFLQFEVAFFPTDSFKFLTVELMGAQNFNLASRFHQNGFFSPKFGIFGLKFLHI